MKVYILSMQQVNNYGSVLQAYSLKKMIESLGNEVRFLAIEKGTDDALSIQCEKKDIDKKNDSWLETQWNRVKGKILGRNLRRVFYEFIFSCIYYIYNCFVSTVLYYISKETVGLPASVQHCILCLFGYFQFDFYGSYRSECFYGWHMADAIF